MNTAFQLFARERVSLLVCYVATYATSSQVLPAVQKAGVPVLVLNLQPTSALDYRATDTGEWLANCSACCVPEISCAFARSHIDFTILNPMLLKELFYPNTIRASWGNLNSYCDVLNSHIYCHRSLVKTMQFYCKTLVRSTMPLVFDLCA